MSEINYIELVKDQIKDVLTQNNGELKINENRDIVNHAKEFGLNERQ